MTNREVLMSLPTPYGNMAVANCDKSQWLEQDAKVALRIGKTSPSLDEKNKVIREAFPWSYSKEGNFFWYLVSTGRFDIVADKYPNTLKDNIGGLNDE